MINIRRSKDRGHADHGWLVTYHTFSFADYYDPNFMSYRSLRVINEDYIQPNQGFPSHPHRNMEILTYVISGSLAHQDSMGNSGVINAGELQMMSAGSGVAHSEYNASKIDPVHLLQIWILPNKNNLIPTYAKWTPPSSLSNKTLIVSPNAEEGSLKINQNTKLYLYSLSPNQIFSHATNPSLGYWIQMIQGNINLLNNVLDPGDAASIENTDSLEVKALGEARFLLFEM